MNNSSNNNLIIEEPIFIFWKDLHSKFLGCSDAFARISGFNSPHELLGKSDYEMPWAEEFADLYIQVDQEILDSNIKKSFVENIRQADGGLISITASKELLLDKNGEKIGVIGSFTKLINQKKQSKPYSTTRHRHSPTKKAACMPLPLTKRIDHETNWQKITHFTTNSRTAFKFIKNKTK